MGRPIPEWTVRFGPDDRIISTTDRNGGEGRLSHVHVETGGITVVTVSALSADRAGFSAVKALNRYQHEMRTRLDASRRSVRVPA